MKLIVLVLSIVAFASGARAQGPAPMDLTTVTKTVTANGLAFPVADHGSGPAVLLLHGFPDSRHLWRHQVGALAAAGLRVIAPDLRGFGDAPKPPAVEDYRIAAIARDVIGILDALQIQRARVVGHDWGAALAWYLAAFHPDRVERLAVLSVGAPGTPGFGALEQREKSWYFLYFQFEGIAEANLSRNDFQMFRQWTRGQGDIERHVKDLARPGALTAGLNWYRANVRPQMPVDKPQPLPKVTANVLGIWSDGDPFLTEQQMTLSAQRVAGTWRYEKVAGAGHWLMLDKPHDVNRLLVDFLKP